VAVGAVPGPITVETLENALGDIDKTKVFPPFAYLRLLDTDPGAVACAFREEADRREALLKGDWHVDSSGEKGRC
jgi:hypothetical protein